MSCSRHTRFDSAPPWHIFYDLSVLLWTEGYDNLKNGMVSLWTEGGVICLF